MLEPNGKLLLKNSIKNAEAYNKASEEEFMWQKWQQERLGRTAHQHPSEISSLSLRQSRSRLAGKFGPHESSRGQRSPSREFSHPSRLESFKEPSSSNFWMRKLAECKELDPNKWSHDGFRDLYPEELQPRELIEKLVDEDVEGRKIADRSPFVEKLSPEDHKRKLFTYISKKKKVSASPTPSDPAYDGRKRSKRKSDWFGEKP